MTVKLTAAQKIKILNADDLFGIMQRVLIREKKIDRDKEHFWLVCLSNSNKILMIELISLGSVKSIVVSPMDVFSFALQKRAVKIIMVHNHPSGELKPSPADIKLTEKMMAIGRFLDLPVVDHLIISEKFYYSFATSGLFQKIEEDSTIDLTFKKQEAQEKKFQQEKLKLVKRIIKTGVNIETIIKASGLTRAEVQALLPKKKK